MLLESRGLNVEHIDTGRISRAGFEAARMGDLALLGAKYEGAKTPEAYPGNIAELLLSLPSTAIMHFDKPDDDASVGRSLMMGVNYHNGHSEGYHRIVVQDPSSQDDGQWELWVPPGSTNRTFYRRRVDGNLHEFERVPANPLKIENYFLHFGSPTAALDDFKNAGFTFSEGDPGDELRDEASEAYRLSVLSDRNRDRWDPFSDQ